MSGSSYNGYDWKTREGILQAYKRGEAGKDFTIVGKPCGLCGDPDRSPGEWHSEDYSLPYSFSPPQTYPLCCSCHGRLHKRFKRPAEEWELFCLHIEAGGYGSEFTKIYPPRQRAGAMEEIAARHEFEVARIREMVVTTRWWRDLTLDSESLTAPWARPRPLRPRPDSDAFRAASNAIGLKDKEAELLRVHAIAPRRTATMRQLSQSVLGRDAPQEINLLYGRLARRFCEHFDWQPDQRADGSQVWMSMVAEGWYPPKRDGLRREYEWVMVSALASLSLR